MSIFEKIELPNVKHIIAVASGKGGVGKSTVSTNLAVALSRQGFKVAIVDADIYGPSVPKMFGEEKAKPSGVEVDGKEKIVPIEKYGVKMNSIGFYFDQSKGLMWRGPVASGALQQLFEDTHWEDIDYMIIDYPPGTGDIQLTISQKVKPQGVIVVTTPQEMALADARRAINLFNTEPLTIPVLGIVENMSWFTPSIHPEEQYYIFGEGGGTKLAEETESELLGQLPLVAELGKAADNGMNVYLTNDTILAKKFDEIAEKVVEKLK